MQLKTRKRARSVVGLVLTDRQLRAFHLIRGKAGLEVVKATSAALTLDILHPEAELVGREIRNHLDAAGIREQRCVVALPSRWVMSQHVKVPEMSPEDSVSFLELEAEKGFPVDPAALQIARSDQRTNGGRFATQLAVRREQLDALGAVLKAANLKPVSFSLGLAVLPGAVPPAGASGRITVAVEPEGVAFLIAAGGGIAAFRTLDANVDTEAGEKIVNGAIVGRELRITLEQIPAELRTTVKELFLTGEGALVRQLAESLANWAGAAGLAIVRGDRPENSLGAEIAENLAASWLAGRGPELDFLPPRPSRWAQLAARYSSHRLVTTGFAAAGLAVIAVIAFAWLEIERWSLRSQWAGMQAQVTDLSGVQTRIREYNPYFDTGFRSLTLLKQVTDCFPDTGIVTAKTFELHDNTVSISGTTRDRAALLRVQQQLRKLKEAQGVNIEGIRSPATGPAQFTLTFRWRPAS